MEQFENEQVSGSGVPESPAQENVQERYQTSPQGMPYGYDRTQWGYGYPPQYRPVQPYPMPPDPPRKKTASSENQKSGHKVWKSLVSCVVVGGLLIANVVMGVSIQRLRRDIQAVRKNSEENLAVMEQKLEDVKVGSDGNSVSGTPNTNPAGLTPGQIFAQNADSVVAINCAMSSVYGQMVSSGSGFIWSDDGYVISNLHVVDGAESITVVTNDGKEYAAKYIGGDASNDIALLKVQAERLQAVTIGSSSSLIVGDQVVAVGNALGKLASTLTVGYVSAMDRIVTTEGNQINMIQTDAAINSGNSGGPLFNMKGEVIGITSAKYSGTSNSGATIEGIGFAIPMDDVLGMLEDLRDYGYITGGYLGVTVSDMDKTDAQLYGLPMGVLVHEVTAGSCAAKGGIRAQDILVELGGYTIENMNDLTRALREFDGGDTVTVVVYRASSGGEMVLTVTLDAKPVTSSNIPSSVPENGSVDDWFDHFFGD